MTSRNSWGTFRYGDIPLGVPVPSGERSRPLAETQNLRWLEENHRNLYRDLTTLPWVRDGVTELEQAAVDNLVYIGGYQVNDLSSVLRLGWVRDDITETEESALDWLSQVSLFTYLGHSSAQNATTIINLPFFRDGGRSVPLSRLAASPGPRRASIYSANFDQSSGSVAYSLVSRMSTPWYCAHCTCQAAIFCRACQSSTGKSSNSTTSAVAQPDQAPAE